MKKIFSALLILLIVLCGPAQAVEIVRQKNVATRIAFPIVNTAGDTVTGAAGLDCEIDEFADGANPTGFTDCTNEATEIGTTGVYYLVLTASEMNQDYIAIQIKTTTSGAKTQHVLIRTLVGDPLNLATTDDGSAINVTSGAIDTVASITNDIGITQSGADKVWSSTTRSLTDKDGFRLSAAGVDDIWDELTSGHGVTGSFGKLVVDNLNATVSSRLASADILLNSGKVTVGINEDKTGYQIAGSKNTLDDLNDVSLLDFFETDSGSDYVSAVAGSVVKEIADNAGGSSLTPQDIWEYGTRTLTSGGYGGLTQSDINAIWDELVTGHSTPSSFGKLLTDNLNATIASRSSHSAADVWAVGSRTVTGGTIDVNNDKSGYSLTQAFPANFSSLVIDANGRVDLGKWLGTAPNALISGRVDSNAQAVGDKTGYSLTQSFPANFSSMALTAGGAVTVATNNDKTGYALTSGQEDALVGKIWDEPASDHLADGTTGRKLNDIPLAGSGDWSTTEKENIRDALGITGAKSAANGGQLQAVKATTDKFIFDASDFIKSTPQTSVIVGTNNDKTGYSLTQSFPGNFSLLSIDSNGRIDLGKWLGGVPNALISGRVDVNAQVVGDKSGYSLMQSFPANFSAFAITAAGAVTVGTNNDKTGYSLTTAQEDAIVDKVWDELRSAHVTSGSFGQGVASVQGNVTGSVNSVTAGVTVTTNNDKTGYRLSASGVDDIWDEPQSGHTGAGTFGEYLDTQISSVTAPTAATVASAVWEETSNHVTDGTMGKKLNDAALAGNPWEAAGICDGFTAGQCLSFIKDSTDGDKEGSDYTGIEKTIRAQR